MNLYMDTPDESMMLRYVAGLATESETRSVEEWAAVCNENEKILSSLLKMYHAQATRHNIDSRDTRSALLKVMDRIKRNLWRQRMKRVAVAASFVVGVAGIGSLAFGWFDRGDAIPSMITVSSNDNARTQIELPDGTGVHLNSGSSVTYPTHFGRGGRNVTLSGEAYFDVARNEDSPFTVTTADGIYSVRVLGTGFNVQAYEQDNIIQTSLIEGSVEIDIAGSTSKVVLSPSQKAVYDSTTGELQVVETDTDRETDWMYGRLVFKKTPMAEVLARLSRFYNVEFDVKNEIIHTYTFTGTFEDKPLYQVLDYMKISSGIGNKTTYRNDGNGTKSVVELSK